MSGLHLSLIAIPADIGKIILKMIEDQIKIIVSKVIEDQIKITHLKTSVLN
jgi:hypothetical protein